MEKSKASEFLERNSSEGRIHVQAALLELWARQQNIITLIEEIKEGLAGCAVYMEKMDERIKKLEPTIQIFSEGEAKQEISKLT